MMNGAKEVVRFRARSMQAAMEYGPTYIRRQPLKYFKGKRRRWMWEQGDDMIIFKICKYLFG